MHARSPHVAVGAVPAVQGREEAALRRSRSSPGSHAVGPPWSPRHPTEGLLAQTPMARVDGARRERRRQLRSSALMQLIDLQALQGRVGQDLGLTENESQAFREGLGKGLRRLTEGGMRAFAQRKGVAKFLRTAQARRQAVQHDPHRVRHRRWTASCSSSSIRRDGKVSVGALRPLLIRPKSEFLINFQYDFINRTVSMAEWTGDIALLLGETADVEDLVPTEREKHLVDTYRSNLKRSMPSATAFPARSAYVRVLDPERNRPKYHLIYLTSHPRGIVEFMLISETVDLIQKQVRASRKDQTRAKRSGMKDMFGADTLVDRDEGHAEPAEVDRYWLGYLRGEPRSIGEAEFGDILEQTNWFPGDLQSSLVRLIDSGAVKNLDANRRRPKKPLHWEKPERLMLVKGAG